MGDRTSIEWTDATWNPVTGCTKVSPGCAHCYAETITLRFKRGGPFLPGKTTIALNWGRLLQPERWRRPRMVFVNSMSDLFHEEVPFSFVDKVFEVMEACSQHCYQVLTKRPERMRDYIQSRYGIKKYPRHVWMGVSVENQFWADRRIPLLRDVPASCRYLSCEPLLKPLVLDLEGIHWVIVGGESGYRARRIDISWVRAIRDQCISAMVPFFFKQWGGRTAKAGGRVLDGIIWSETPSIVENLVTRNESRRDGEQLPTSREPGVTRLVATIL